MQAIGVIYDMTSTGAADNYYNYIKAAAGNAVNLVRINIDTGITSVAAVTALINTNLLTGGITIANSGLLVPATGLTANRRTFIIQAVNTLQLKAVYPNRMYVTHRQITG